MINNKQRGAVSLFIVVFAALLITVVTVSFIRSMTSDQQMASTTDLSQSAYDSALAGQEDAKRAILRYQAMCSNSTNPITCASLSNIDINSATCNTAISKLNDVKFTNDEVKIIQQTDDSALDQAYTCVKINLNTDDYLGTLDQDGSKIVPISGVSDFNSIKIEWFTTRDLSGLSTNVDVPLLSAGTPLLSQSSWTTTSTPNRPSIIRAQFMQVQNNNGGFTLTDMDNNTIKATNNTLFLYPTNSTAAQSATFAFTSDIRKTEKNIIPVYCYSSLSSQLYSCSAKINLPVTVRNSEKTAYLNISSIYKKANYRVTLYNNNSLVQFNAVQPEIDSTGRANDLLRRVKSRVEMSDINFPYPDMAVDVSGNLCKDFKVTDDSNDYSSINPVPCNP